MPTDTYGAQLTTEPTVILFAWIDTQYGEPVPHSQVWLWRGRPCDIRECTAFVQRNPPGIFVRVYTYPSAAADPHDLAMTEVLADYTAEAKCTAA